MKRLISLDNLAKGTTARIAALDLPPAEAQRLMEMGLVRGTLVQVVRRAPFGDPIQLGVRHTSLSVRKATAACIKVEIENAS